MQIGRYEIIKIIGEGASGRVARAYDPLIGRTVAVKLLPRQFASGPAHDKFIQEARVIGQLSHPSIITLHDMGVDCPTSRQGYRQGLRAVSKSVRVGGRYCHGTRRGSPQRRVSRGRKARQHFRHR